MCRSIERGIFGALSKGALFNFGGKYMKKLLSLILIIMTILTSCQSHTHDFSCQKIDSKYLAKSASCTELAQYYYSCSCGEVSNDTFSYGNVELHQFTNKVIEDDFLCNDATKSSPATYYYSCAVCNCIGTDTFEYGDRLYDSWGYGYYIDHMFGDETDLWYITTIYLVEGTFENTATEESELKVKILYDCNDEITIFLYEYGNEDYLVKNSSSDNKRYYSITMRNDKKQVLEARGQMWPGEDRIYIIDTYHDDVLDMMKNSEKIKFYIVDETHPTTQYRVEIDMIDFNEALEDMLS